LAQERQFDLAELGIIQRERSPALDPGQPKPFNLLPLLALFRHGLRGGLIDVESRNIERFSGR
jgi:hypothetical protein